MKKLISFLLCMILMISLASCGSGTSVAIGRVRVENKIRNLFMRDPTLASFVETVIYYDGKGAERFSYTLVYERAEDLYAGFNLAETVGDNVFYAYEGSVFTSEGEDITAVLLLSSYQDLLTSYMDTEFPFDGEKLNQTSMREEDGMTVIGYSTEPSPQMLGELAEYGITKDMTILSEYTIDQDGFVPSISYFTAVGNGKEIIARRTFEKKTEKTEGLFGKISSLTPSVSVDILFAGEGSGGRHFTVPSGVYVGIETGKNAYDFYYDEALERPYSYKDGRITENTVIYAKKKSA